MFIAAGFSVNRFVQTADIVFYKVKYGSYYLSWVFYPLQHPKLTRSVSMEKFRSDTVGSDTQKYTYAWLLSRMLRHPKAILGTLMLVTILLALQIPDLVLRFSIYDLIIEELPETRTYQRHIRVFDSEKILRIVIRTQNIYNPAVFYTIDRISTAAGRIPDVVQVISLPQIKNAVESNNALDLDRFKQIAGPMELFQRYLMSSDGKVTSIVLMLARGADQAAVIKQITELLESAEISGAAYQTGMPLINYRFEELIHNNFLLFPPLLFFLIAIFLLLLLRQTAPVVLILSCIALSLIWTIGLMALIGLPLSALSFVALIFLLSVQTAYGLHVAAIYLNGSKGATTPREAAFIGFTRVPLPFILSIITTLIGLLSFLFNPIDAINQFGVFIFTGMLTFLLLSFIFFPVALSLFPIAKARPCDGKKLITDWAKRWTSFIGMKKNVRRCILPIFAAITIISLMGLARIKIETNLIRFFKSDSEIVENYNDTSKYLSGNFPICVRIKAPKKEYFLNPVNVERIQQFQRFLESLPGVEQAISFADHIKLFNYTTNGFNLEDYRIPAPPGELGRLTNSYQSMLGWKELQAYMNSDFSETNILMFTYAPNYKQLNQLCQMIEKQAEKAAFLDLKVDVTGIGMVLSASNAHLAYGQIKSLAIALIMVFGILWFLLISVKLGLIAVLPTVFPIVFTFGVIGWLGLDHTIFTSLIATIFISLSVVNVIHYIVCYNHELKKNLDHGRALETAIEITGSPILQGAVAIGFGFSILYFSDFKPISFFGVMMALAAVASVASNLIILPMLLHKVELVTAWDLLHIKLVGSPNNDIPIFKGLARHQIHSILMAGNLQKLSPREILFNKGDMSDTMYAIVSGSLDIISSHRYEDASGVHEIQKVVNQLQVGDVVGEMGFFRSTRRSATVAATENTEILQIDWQMIRRLQWLYPLTAQIFFINLMGIVCDRLENMTNTLSDQSLIDDLTGLFNKKGFTQLLETETNRAQQYREELTLCLIGLDMTDKISSANPKTTEVMIRTVCQMLSREIRRTDILSRIDTTTFAMVAPKTSKPQANILCKRLHQVLHRNLFGFGSPSLKVRLAATNLDSGKESGMDLLERSLTLLQNGQE